MDTSQIIDNKNSKFYHSRGLRTGVFGGIVYISIFNLVKHTFSPEAMVGTFGSRVVLNGWVCLWVYFNIEIADFRRMQSLFPPPSPYQRFKKIAYYVFGLLPAYFMLFSIDHIRNLMNPYFLFLLISFICVPFLHSFINISPIKD